MTYKQVKEKEKKAEDASEAAKDAMAEDADNVVADEDETTDPKQRFIARMMQNATRQPQTNGTNGMSNGQSEESPPSPSGQRTIHSMADRTAQNGHARPTEDDVDIEMEDQD